MSEPTTNKKRFKGVIVSTAMTDTVVVRVDRYYQHSKYQKFVRAQKKYQVHDPGHNRQLGEKVEIEAIRPVSKNKKFKVVNG